MNNTDTLFDITLLQPILVFIATIIASSGFWMYMIKRMESRDSLKKLIMGMAHDRIMFLGMSYIERGTITQDEYENLCEFLYVPYKDIGGNGSTKRLMTEIDKLPIVKSIPYIFPPKIRSNK